MIVDASYETLLVETRDDVLTITREGDTLRVDIDIADVAAYVERLLEKDPDELTNEYGNPEYAEEVAAMKAELEGLDARRDALDAQLDGDQFGQIGVQFGADVLAHVHVGNVDGQDLERGAAVQSLRQHCLRNRVRVLEHGLVRVRGTDGADDTLADPGQDRLLTGATHQALDVGADGDATDRLDLDAVEFEVAVQ